MEHRRFAVCHLGGHPVGTVGDNGKTAVIRCHIHGGDELGPAHVHIGQTALVAGGHAVGGLTAPVIRLLVVAADGHYPVFRLKIDVPRKIGGKAGGQGIVGHILQFVSDPALADDAHACFVRKHTLHYGTGFQSPVGVIFPCHLVRVHEAVNPSVVDAPVADGFPEGNAVLLLACHLPQNGRGAECQGGVHRVFTGGSIDVHVRPGPVTVFGAGRFCNHLRKTQQPVTVLRLCRIVYAVVVPEDYFDIFAAAGNAPELEGIFGNLGHLEGKIAAQHFHYPLIGIPLVFGGFIVIPEGAQHHHMRPPVVPGEGGSVPVDGGTEIAGLLAAFQNGIDPLHGHFF